MPAPIDLAGRRIGALVVLSRGPRVFWGRWQSAWVCQCDCGATLEVPQNRLPYRKLPAGHIIDRCGDCRAKPCCVCGAPVAASSASLTCSAACRDERRRAYDRAWKVQRYATDAFAREAAKERSRQWAADPANRERVNEKGRRWRRSVGLGEIARRARERYAVAVTDEAWRAANADTRASWRNENRDRVRSYDRTYRRRRARLEAAREIGNLIGDRDDE